MKESWRHTRSNLFITRTPINNKNNNNNNNENAIFYLYCISWQVGVSCMIILTYDKQDNTLLTPQLTTPPKQREVLLSY